VGGKGWEGRQETCSTDEVNPASGTSDGLNIPFLVLIPYPGLVGGFPIVGGTRFLIINIVTVVHQSEFLDLV